MSQPKTNSAKWPGCDALFDLVRLPAALSVPGDTFAGATSGGSRSVTRTVGLAASSVLLYWSGMALNDYADREIDAQERPQRPIPSGRIEPGFALGVAGSLTVVGVGLAAIAGGRRGALVATGLAASIWSYDMALKNGPAGPLAMASCRAIDVLLGASDSSIARAMPSAALIGAHTYTLTSVSRHEVQGGSADLLRRARARTSCITTAAGGLAVLSALQSPNKIERLARLSTSAGLILNFVKPVADVQKSAIDEPQPRNLQRVVGTSIQAMIPLQASICASRGRFVSAGVIAGAWPVARRLARRRALT